MKKETYWQVVWFVYFFAAMMIHHGWSKGHMIVLFAAIWGWCVSRICVAKDEQPSA
jgi:hypothetical protein